MDKKNPESSEQPKSCIPTNTIIHDIFFTVMYRCFQEGGYTQAMNVVKDTPYASAPRKTMIKIMVFRYYMEANHSRMIGTLRHSARAFAVKLAADELPCLDTGIALHSKLLGNLNVCSNPWQKAVLFLLYGVEVSMKVVIWELNCLKASLVYRWCLRFLVLTELVLEISEEGMNEFTDFALTIGKCPDENVEPAESWSRLKLVKTKSCLHTESAPIEGCLSMGPVPVESGLQAELVHVESCVHTECVQSEYRCQMALF